LECVRLAGAFGRFGAPESGSKLPYSKRFALACAIPRGLNIVETVARILCNLSGVLLLVINGYESYGFFDRRTGRFISSAALLGLFIGAAAA
jgi:small-conductance mechanosensitive channel